MKSEEVRQPPKPKLARVSIVGCPNAGKSTLLNQLIQWKVSSVSSKVHTTRKNVIGVYTHEDSGTQIEFIDTPGFVSRRHILRHKLDASFITDVHYSLNNTDVIAVLVDASNKLEQERLHIGILELLRKRRDKESILILNKVDKVKYKRRLLEIANNLTLGIVDGNLINKPDNTELKIELKNKNFETLFKRTEHYLNYKDEKSELNLESNVGWSNFSHVFMISALNDEGVDYLRNYLLNRATSRPWLYNEDFVTKQQPKKLIYDAMREVCLDMFFQEIPYNINFEIVMWEMDELGNLYLVVNMFCPKKFLPHIIGPKGVNISTIVRKSRESLSNIFRCDVSLKLTVKPQNK